MTNPIVKSDVAIFGYSDSEKAKLDTAKLDSPGVHRRLVQVHLSPSQDGRHQPIYFAIIEGELCPCCRQKITELGDFDGNDHHTEDRAMDHRMATAGG